MEYYQYNREDYLNLPDQPGVYKFFNKNKKIIYVGKAKSLKKRVSSYFNKTGQQNRKTIKLVGEIAFIEVTIVNSEFDALLLENNLIKENQPKYNILLKDDKSFPSILITNERFPRIYSTRRIDKSKGEYFGPYTSVKAMNSVLDLLRKLYKIRTCKYVLSENNIEKGKFKVCLEYHIGNCKGPCEGLQTEDDYLNEISQAREILKGNVTVVKTSFKEGMQTAAENLQFEVAQEFKDKLELLDKFQTRSLIVNQKVTDIDVFTILRDQKHAFINYMKIDQGSIRASETVEIKLKMDETKEEVLEYAIPLLRHKFQSTNPEILSNIDLEMDTDDIHVIVPQIGDKRKLVDLSLKNALMFKKQKIEEKSKNQYGTKTHLLFQLKEDLRLKDVPEHIECFDNSNIQGTNPVASMVCFKNGKPAKSEYRKFNIKTVIGPDDFGSMKEIVTRRYTRLVDENLPLPNLIVIDGGKGQLNAAVEALKEMNLYGQIPVVGIAKRLEEIYFPDDSIPLHINKKSESLKLIQHLRDEAHRFAITFHRQKRSKAANVSELDKIPGIGFKTRSDLLSKFKSVKRVREASEEEVAEVIGPSKARSVVEYFNKKGSQ
jgi:excinuclease ABC subunit C